MIGSGTWKESGCITKNVERKKNTKVTMEEASMLDITRARIICLVSTGFYTLIDRKWQRSAR